MSNVPCVRCGTSIEGEAHTPCCSSHGKILCCECYRRTHFCEVRPCCSTDARRQDTTVRDDWIYSHREIRNDTAQPRQTRVREPVGWPWPGQPWPWCEHRTDPHDHHITNGGNTLCPGLPGKIPQVTVSRAESLAAQAAADVAVARRRYDEARDEFVKATSRLDVIESVLAEVRTQPRKDATQ